MTPADRIRVPGARVVFVRRDGPTKPRLIRRPDGRDDDGNTFVQFVTGVI